MNPGAWGGAAAPAESQREILRGGDGWWVLKAEKKVAWKIGWEEKGRNGAWGSEPYCTKAWRRQSMTDSGTCRRSAGAGRWRARWRRGVGRSREAAEAWSQSVWVPRKEGTVKENNQLWHRKLQRVQFKSPAETDEDGVSSRILGKEGNSEATWVPSWGWRVWPGGGATCNNIFSSLGKERCFVRSCKHPASALLCVAHKRCHPSSSRLDDWLKI